MAPADSSYTVHFGRLPEVGSLAARWRALEARSTCSIFLSWLWIGSWLAVICPKHTARLVSVEFEGRCVAMALFTLRRRFYGIGPRHLRLHETGNRDLDSLTIEYNGLLSESGHERDALAALVRHLVEAGGWLSLHLPGLDADAVPHESFLLPGIELRRTVRPTYHVALDELRGRQSDYVDSLSSGTRAKIRRTGRKIAGLAGEIGLEHAASASHKQEFFSKLIVLHQAHWSEDESAGGAFKDRQIIEFHRRLIEGSSAQAGVQLLRVTAGTETLGYVYGLSWRGITYFYQAGIDYRRFGLCGSPGLFLLSHAVQHALDQGMTRYEFMAGNAPYKRTLGSAEGRMLWLSLDRVGLTGRARRLWWALRRSRE